ncbi:MAG: AMP-binding protein [Fimbriimonadaceae bacterium]|nr:AMP-binding protein [Alphaproteobacteria bacterium]
MSPPLAQKFWNPDVETLGHDELRDLQWERLKPQLKYNFDSSPFYREKFAAIGATPEDITSWEQFQRIPLMNKDEHREVQERGLAEFGDPLALMNCAQRDRIVRINATSGTTGMPTLYAVTQNDVDIVNEMHARKYWRAGMRPGDVMIQALSLSMFTGGLPLSQGIMHMGACCVPVGIAGGTKRVLDFLTLTKARAMIATPSFGLHLIDQCRKHTGEPAAALGIDTFFCAGEPGGGDPAVRVALAEGFGGVRIFDHTGGGHAFHGISREEPANQFSGMYFISADHCVLELVDPNTKNPIELKDGATGEMVWTFLNWQGGPFMRYAMGDVARVFISPCASEMPGLRFSIVGRADDMLIVKGVNVYPAAIQNELFTFRPHITGIFRVLLDAPGPKIKPPVRLSVEHGENTAPTDLDDLAARIIDHLRQSLRITTTITWLPPNHLPRGSHKTQLIEIRTPE